MNTVGTSQYRRGFTIVELLIVIVIIGILAALVIVAYNGVQERAHEAAMKSEMRKIISKIELYKADKGTYPSNFSELSTLRLGLSKDQYQKSSGNVIYCVSAGGADFAVGIILKDDRKYASGSSLSWEEVNPPLSWNGGGPNVCAELGITHTYWTWGFQPSGWGFPGWAGWTSS